MSFKVPDRRPRDVISLINRFDSPASMLGHNKWSI